MCLIYNWSLVRLPHGDVKEPGTFPAEKADEAVGQFEARRSVITRTLYRWGLASFISLHGTPSHHTLVVS